jgi:peptide/nickel transport system substrate-binding protein
MVRRIRWQIIIAATSSLLITILLSRLTLSTTVSRPEMGGTMVEIVLGTPQHIIPLVNDPLSDPVGRDLGALMFDGLTRIGLDGLPETALAESWEIDPLGEVYTVRLRRDVVWHDGEVFNADDVVFTIQAIQDSGFVGDASLAALWQNVLVDRIDDYTVRFTLDAPYAPFLSTMRVPILPSHLLANVEMAQWSDLPFSRQPVGTGPYHLVELSETQARLTANPSYFGGTPFIDHIELRFLDSPQAALSMLTRREARAAGFSGLREINQVALPESFRRVHVPQDSYAILSFNTRLAPLDTLEMRQALAHGLNKDTLLTRSLEPEGSEIDGSRPDANTPDNGNGANGSTLANNIANGNPPDNGDTPTGGCTPDGCRVDTPILPGWWAHDPAVQWYRYDPEMAGQMLDSLGYLLNEQGARQAAGQPLVFPLITGKAPEWLATAKEVARQWGELGIRVEVEQLEPDILRERLQSRDFVLAIHGWSRLGPDPDVFELWHSSQAADGMNYAGLQDETIDTMLSRGRTEHNLAARSNSYARFQERWVELVPAIILYQPTYTFVSSEELRGLGFAEEGDETIASSNLLVGHEDRYRYITEWFINSSREIRGRLP